jgi:trans-aconitate 2-methyltransferase
MTWNPQQYLKFSESRLRPAVDLLGRIGVEAPDVVYDLGCGAGNVTRLLVERWPRADVTGIDDSAEMLARAAKELPQVKWINLGVQSWQPEKPANLIYSNAALHWLPDHQSLFPALMNKLAPGGTLAVQMPRNFSAPSHTSIADTVRAGPWRSKLEHLLGPSPVGSPDEYYALLAPVARNIDIWETEYLQALQGEDPVKEWTKGTWLTRFLPYLDASERPAFEEDYARRLRSAYPRRADGTTLFPFRRLFIVCQKP